MEQKRDVVIGFITGYDYDKIKTWVNSLNRSGFTGEKVMICYNISYVTANKLTEQGFTVMAFEKDDKNETLVYRKNKFNICVERFLHIWHLLNDKRGQYRYMITTDVKDVVFQSNPSDWLEKNIGDKKINAASESIIYQDEEWGTHNLFRSFGTIVHQAHRENLIVNAGTISGEFDTMLDLCLNVYLLSNGAPSHHIEGGGGPDQAALNVLLNMETYKNVTNVAPSESGWAAQLGTTGPQIANKYSERLVEKSPILVGDTVCTSDGTPFAIVHQYDRVPQWKSIIEKKYE